MKRINIIQEKSYQYTRAGETTWNVDNEGIITLKVGDNIINEGKDNNLNEENKNTEVVSKEEYDELKNEVTSLIGRLESLENNTVKKGEFNKRTTMKTLSKNVENISIKEWTGTKIISITIPEDCYAFIQGSSQIIDRSGSINGKYYCISITVNDQNISGTDGGVYNIDPQISCSYELKKGDIVDLIMYHQANPYTSFSGNMVINYFPKN